MAFKKLLTITLTGENSTGQLKAGDLKLTKGHNARAIRLKCRAFLKNSGSARALTTTEKQAFLASAFDYTLSWGADGQHKPRSNVNFDREQTNMRQMGGTEMEGYSDALTGLGKTITSSATEVVWYQRLHLCEVQKDSETDDLWGVGPTQALTIVVDFRRLVATLPSGFTLDGNVYFDVIPDEFQSKYDRVTPIPRWHQFSEDNRTATFPGGLPWYCIERSATHVNSVLTDVSFAIDGLLIYTKVSLQEWLSKLLDTTRNYAAEDQTFDRDTVLHTIVPGTRLRNFATGSAIIEQDTQTLSKMLLGILYTEVIPDTAIERDLREFARLKKRRVSAVSLASILRMDLPKNLYFALPYVLLDEEDAEFDKFSGLMCEPGGDPQIYLPATAVGATRERVAMREANGEFLAAEDEIRQLVLPVPGAVQSPRGFGQGSSKYLEAARTAVRAG